jgi:N-acetylglutamate synthase/N-acetylornithine aminotransferase|tara:strand:+ start:218 stop:553 length:336 start_codon:yes stop_codon:yes gene_type:complete
MALQQVSIAAATAVVGYDLLKDAIFQSQPFRRRIVAAGVAGSAAALDTEIRLTIGSNEIAQMFNSSTGAVTKNADMFRLGDIVPPNQQLHAYVTDAPATNPINVALDLIPA